MESCTHALVKLDMEDPIYQCTTGTCTVCGLRVCKIGTCECTFSDNFHENEECTWTVHIDHSNPRRRCHICNCKVRTAASFDPVTCVWCATHK
jgi:hypothetical protein